MNADKLNDTLNEAKATWNNQSSEFRSENPLYTFLGFASAEEYARWDADHSEIHRIVAQRVTAKMTKEGSK